MKARMICDRTVRGSARRVTIGVAVVAASAAAGLLLLDGGPAVGALGGARMKAALSDPLFVWCGLVTAGCAVGLAALCGAMWAAGTSARARRGRDGRGACLAATRRGASASGEPLAGALPSGSPLNRDDAGDMALPVRGEGHVGARREEETTEEKTTEEETARGQDARGTQGRDALATEEGAATLEFALVLPIALMIVLVMIQSSLLMGGNLCTHYAAYCAARSAIVNVPRNFADEPPNVVGDAASSSKLRRVQMAAIWAVMPVSCTHRDGPSVSASGLEEALSAVFAAAPGGTPPWVSRDMGRRMAYAQDHTTVDLEPPTGQPVPGGGAIAPPVAKAGAYAAGEDLRVHVRHDFYLSVPYASRIFSKVAGDGMQLDFGQGQYALTIRAACTLTNEGEQDFVDVESFPKDRHRN